MSEMFLLDVMEKVRLNCVRYTALLCFLVKIKFLFLINNPASCIHKNLRNILHVIILFYYIRLVEITKDIYCDM